MPISSSKLYDLAMRVPIAALTLYFLARELDGLRAAIGRHPVLDDDPQFLLGVAARVAVMEFLLLLPRAPANVWFDGASTLLILGGNIVCVLALLSLGRSLSILPEARKLVTEGLYRRIRHPLYLAEEIAIIGLFLQYRSWTAAAIVIVHAALQLRRMAWEEQVLGETFPEYGAYAQRTDRVIPGVY